LVQIHHPEKDLFFFGGYSETLDRLADIVRYLQDPWQYTQAKVKPSKGVILSGPPGVGKTYVAELIAGHAGVPLIVINAGEMNGYLVGSSQANLRSAFAKATKVAPCILLIDEIDSIASKRINANIEESANTQVHANYLRDTTNQLLTLLGQANPGIVVIGTTNDFKILDSAVIRPGRFDKHITLSLPNALERFHILEVLISKLRVGPDVSLKDQATLCTGFSGAKIAALVNEASLNSLREQSRLIHTKHFDQAREFIELGISKEASFQLGEKKRIAGHEAGHSFVGIFLKHNLYKVSLKQYGDSRGFTLWMPQGENGDQTKQENLDSICILLAGRAAEMLTNEPTIGCQMDFQEAKKIASRMVTQYGMGLTITGNQSSLEIEMILQEQLQRAHTILKDNGAIWELIRDTLIEHDELYKEDILQLIKGEKLSKKKRDQFLIKNKILELPPSRSKKSKQTKEKERLETVLPFSIEQLAKALQVRPKHIREVTEFLGGYPIRFKPSIDTPMEDMRVELIENGIEHVFLSIAKEINICKEEVERFIEFVKERGN
jgi:cell division protease FtsH